MPSNPNKAYVVITGINGVGTDLGVAFFFRAVDSNGDPVGTDFADSGNVAFSYGDSNHQILDLVAANVRGRVGDPELDVNFISG
jgi:hypothetical protein